MIPLGPTSWQLGTPSPRMASTFALLIIFAPCRILLFIGTLPKQFNMVDGGDFRLPQSHL